jgi:hypothetical protein
MENMQQIILQSKKKNIHMYDKKMYYYCIFVVSISLSLKKMAIYLKNNNNNNVVVFAWMKEKNS